MGRDDRRRLSFWTRASTAGPTISCPEALSPRSLRAATNTPELQPTSRAAVLRWRCVGELPSNVPEPVSPVVFLDYVRVRDITCRIAKVPEYRTPLVQPPWGLDPVRHGGNLNSEDTQIDHLACSFGEKSRKSAHGGYSRNIATASNRLQEAFSPKKDHGSPLQYRNYAQNPATSAKAPPTENRHIYTPYPCASIPRRTLILIEAKRRVLSKTQTGNR